MATNKRPIEFRDYLPEVFRADEVDGVSFLSQFLKAFQDRFEELEAEIEGPPNLTSGGIPDLFDPNTTPPPQFAHLPQPKFDYLEYLASWIGLPLRTDVARRAGETETQYETRRLQHNRAFFNQAIPLYAKRGTLAGLEAMLRAWLQDELAELLLTDLTRINNDIDTIFQLAPENAVDKVPGEVYAQVGLNTVLGEGPPFFFIVDLTINPSLPATERDLIEQAVRFLLDAEKPSYTYYELRLR